MNALPLTAALIVIDVQLAIDDPRWAAQGPRNTPEAERNIASLLAAWRRIGRPIVHIRHDSTEPASSFRPGGPGHPFKPEAEPLPGETVIGKTTPDAFIRTDLDLVLKNRECRTLVVCGVITNNSVEATVRTAGCLGYDTQVVADACFTFAMQDWSGRLRTAEDVHDLSLANMAMDYAAIATTAGVLSRT